MPDANDTFQRLPATRRAMPGWLFPALRVLLVVAAGFLSGMWRDTGTDGPEGRATSSTNDAYTAGDVTPLAAKVSGYVATVGVTDYQTVQKAT